jgi:hypothetical protein
MGAAHNTIGPAQLHHERLAIFEFFEVYDGLLKGGWFHMNPVSTESSRYVVPLAWPEGVVMISEDSHVWFRSEDRERFGKGLSHRPLSEFLEEFRILESAGGNLGK